MTGAIARGALVTASGAAALVYQVLWVRQIGLVVGSTAQAAAIAIAVFFAGLAIGGWFWGSRSASARRPLMWFGALEVGVALTALGHFALVPLTRSVMPWSAVSGTAPVLELATILTVSTVLLLPPAILMGGTLPLMVQDLVRTRTDLARVGSRLYALNTAGGAAGALAAGFVLPMALGLRNAYLLAVGVDLAVGLAALALASRSAPSAPAQMPDRERASVAPPGGSTVAPSGRSVPPVIWVVAFASGAATLAIEIVWTRLFSQVLQNSVYTYSAVLTTFLVALALGAVVSNRLIRLRRPDGHAMLTILLLASGAAAGASPWVVHRATDGLRTIGGDLDWSGYIVAVGVLAVIVIGIPAVVLGTVLPYLLRMLQAGDHVPGRTIGRLIAVNTTGAIAGSLVGGFVVVPVLGAWRGLLVLAAIYPVLAVAVLATNTATRPRVRVTSVTTAGVLAVALLATPTSGFVNAGLLGPGEHLVSMREGLQANVAVVADGDGELSIRVNNTYTLGGTRGLDSERNQTVIPLLAHPSPSSVFYLGMGTGITAGASLAFPVERVVVCELLGDVVQAAERHFEPWINGLFEDPRASVHAADGRSCLHANDETFDLIISDLFTPWEAGTGNLYTLEHFRTARDRLEPGGAFVQWIPLYQVSDRELGIIARTMDEVFDEVTMWRGDLFSSRSIVALVGRPEPEPIDPAVVVHNARSLDPGPVRTDGELEAMVLRMYVGNVSAGGVFADRDLNTDDHPFIEHLTPRTQRAVRAGNASFVVGAERERVYSDLARAVPPEIDPHLALLDDVQLDQVRAGRAMSAARWFDSIGDPARADPLFAEFDALSPPGARRDLSPSRTLLAQVSR